LAVEVELFRPGSLWGLLTQSTERALRSGALQPIPTEFEFVEQGGVRFLVRRLARLERKKAAREEQAKAAAATGKLPNPFSPYEEAMFVAEITETHLGLLNKFNVVEHHLLIVTRDFEEQDSLLTAEDFRALWRCMAEYESLGFYNAGTIAGASQRHKHLQVVPLPLAPEGPSVPTGPLLERARYAGRIGRSPDLPFLHAVGRVEPDWPASPDDAGEATRERYLALLRAVGLLDQSAADPSSRPDPYNLLVTREWMLLLPRSEESFRSISVNGLGFAGSLLVWNEEQLEAVKRHGPMRILTSVTCDRDRTGGADSRR
jgi:ATP adenylyltransferase